MEYVNDLQHNYVAILYEGKITEFALQMILKNEIDGFIRPQLRNLDGETFLYYEISGKQSMENAFLDKTIEREQFQSLLWDLKRVQEQLQEFFLGSGGLCLNSEEIFWNMEKVCFEFLYCPVEKKEIDWKNLADFVVRHIDHDDDKLVKTAYQFYQDTITGRPFLDSYLEGLQEETESDSFEPYYAEQIETEFLVKEEGQNYDAHNEQIVKIKPSEKTVKENHIHIYGLRVLFGVYLCLLMGGTVWAGYRSPLYYRIGGGLIMVSVLLFLLLSHWRGRKSGDEMTEKEEIEDEDNTYIIYEETGNLEEQDYEQTVYMELDMDKVGKLYGTGDFKHLIIDLEKLPCIIGKDPTYASAVIQNPVVSRMHARIDKIEDELYLQDTNSRNGTYINGERLAPYQRVGLQSGDEVILGKVTFVYR